MTRTSRIIPLIALVILLNSPGASPVFAEPGWWAPEPGLAWQIQFSGEEIVTSLDVDVYDLDGFETDAGTVADLKARGARVICYINVGAHEDWRPDAGEFPAEVIGKAWDEWDGERFLDIRRLDVLAPILEARFDMCRDKGFDAIEPDNIDTFQNGEDVTGFDLTEADQLAFNRWLSGAAHERGLSIGQKNIPELTGELLPHFDFAITEDCFVDDWCDDVQPYLDADKAVFAIEYTDTSADLATICPEAQEAGYSVVLKHRNLDAWHQTCP